VENQRLSLVEAYLQNKATMTDLCLHYSISRKTAYKWLERYHQLGVDGLKDQPKAPHTPHTRFEEAQIDLAIDLKLKHRTWGPKKILAKLIGIYPEIDWPSQTRLYEIFKDHHLVKKRRMKGRVPATSPLVGVSGPNDTWAVDFKGWFLTGNGQKCEPFTLTDCASRYLLRCTHLDRHPVEYVWPLFDEAFREYGLPLRVRSDNGPPFATTGVGRLSLLSIKLIKAGVIPEWIQPGHPEENGRHERFHLTLKQEIASPPKETLNLQIQAMNEFDQEYNFERPHEALGMKTPASCYQKSIRRWSGILKSPEYSSKDIKPRKVCSRGGVSILDVNYYLSENLTGEYVGVKKNEVESGYEFEVYFGPVYLGKVVNGAFERPKINRRRQR
jgi:transposase InsO family protein